MTSPVLQAVWVFDILRRVEIDVSKLITDAIVDAHVSVKGRKPDGWSIDPDEDTVAQMTAGFTEKGRPPDYKGIIAFVKMSVYAHLSRTNDTGTKYYVNKFLLNSKCMDYVEKHTDYLKSFYCKGTEPTKFRDSVYAAVYATEIDWLDFVGRKQVVHGWEPAQIQLSASVWWVLCCNEFGRTVSGEEPPAWLKMESEHDDVISSNRESLAAEKKACKDDKHRWRLAQEAASRAIFDATMSWCRNFPGVLRLIYHPSHCEVASDSGVSRAQMEVSKPMSDRDQELFGVVRFKCSTVIKQGNATKVIKPPTSYQLAALADRVDV